MNPEIIKQTADMGGTVVVAVMALYAFIQVFKIKKNGGADYKAELASIDKKLNNHLTEVNGKIENIKNNTTEMKMDIKNIQQDIIKILIKK